MAVLEHDPRNVGKQLADLRAIVDELLRHRHGPPDAPPAGGGGGPNVGALTWASSKALSTGTFQRFYAPFSGTISFVRAERSAGNGTTDAVFDVKRNGDSIFATNPKPRVDAGDFLGPKRVPDEVVFVEGDYFEVQVMQTGGGTGPLRVTIAFEEG